MGDNVSSTAGAQHPSESVGRRKVTEHLDHLEALKKRRKELQQQQARTLYISKAVDHPEQVSGGRTIFTLPHKILNLEEPERPFDKSSTGKHEPQVQRVANGHATVSPYIPPKGQIQADVGHKSSDDIKRPPGKRLHPKFRTDVLHEVTEEPGFGMNGLSSTQQRTNYSSFQSPTSSGPFCERCKCKINPDAAFCPYCKVQVNANMSRSQSEQNFSYQETPPELPPKPKSGPSTTATRELQVYGASATRERQDITTAQEQVFRASAHATAEAVQQHRRTHLQNIDPASLGLQPSLSPPLSRRLPPDGQSIVTKAPAILAPTDPMYQNQGATAAVHDSLLDKGGASGTSDPMGHTPFKSKHLLEKEQAWKEHQLARGVRPEDLKPLEDAYTEEKKPPTPVKTQKRKIIDTTNIPRVKFSEVSLAEMREQEKQKKMMDKMASDGEYLMKWVKVSKHNC